MIVDVDGQSTYVYTGGEEHRADAPAAVFIHGAAMDHTIWTLYSRYWAKAGFNVVAIDLPGHGLSQGQPLGSIEQNADFVKTLLDQLNLTKELHVVGHSMGSLIGLECAANIDGTVRLAMLGTAYPMKVGKPLMDAAMANQSESVDMITHFGHSFGSQLGGNPVAGIYVPNLSQRLMQQAGPGVMHSDLQACDNYRGAESSAARVKCKTGLILGQYDAMTPPAAAAALVELLADSTVFNIEDCGHMMMVEKPELTHRALCDLFAVSK